ncbi:MAG: chalcone isomerase family protein [Chitinophagaceae bacterium]|nr:chalcone isomerase family protein [Chitinophagaceae bacterium]
MKTQIIIVFFALSSPFISAAQKIIHDIKIEDKLSIEGQHLTLNGAGTRVKMFMDFYVGSLYVTHKSEDGKAIASSNKAMAIKIDIVSGLISSERMISAIHEGFEASTGGKTSPLQEYITTFITFFQEPIMKRDVFIILYVPNTGVSVYKNGVKKGTIKDNSDFKKALFEIWLGDGAIDKNLKREMLGK